MGQGQKTPIAVAGMPASARPSGGWRIGSPCTALAAVIVANYVAQVPYALHLYGPRFDLRGSALLLLTLLWFLAGLRLASRGQAIGSRLLLSFLLADFGFYLYNAVAGTLHGYGPRYHLERVADPLLWVVFLIGYLNMLAAGGLLWHLLARRRDRL